jgi:hypothetical protein
MRPSPCQSVVGSVPFKFRAAILPPHLSTSPGPGCSTSRRPPPKNQPGALCLVWSRRSPLSGQGLGVADDERGKGAREALGGARNKVDGRAGPVARPESECKSGNGWKKRARSRSLRPDSDGSALFSFCLAPSRMPLRGRAPGIAVRYSVWPDRPCPVEQACGQCGQYCLQVDHQSIAHRRTRRGQGAVNPSIASNVEA